MTGERARRDRSAQELIDAVERTVRDGGAGVTRTRPDRLIGGNGSITAASRTRRREVEDRSAARPIHIYGTLEGSASSFLATSGGHDSTDGDNYRAKSALQDPPDATRLSYRRSGAKEEYAPRTPSFPIIIDRAQRPDTFFGEGSSPNRPPTRCAGALSVLETSDRESGLTVHGKGPTSHGGAAFSTRADQP